MSFGMLISNGWRLALWKGSAFEMPSNLIEIKLHLISLNEAFASYCDKTRLQASLWREKLCASAQSQFNANAMAAMINYA